MQKKKNKEIKSVIEKIIKDHVNYSCSENTHKLLNVNQNVEDMSTRIRLISYIKNNESYETFMSLKDTEGIEEDLIIKLAKLSFIDFIINNKLEEGISFASRYFNTLGDKALLSLIGYGSSNIEEFNKLSSSINRKEIISRVNLLYFKRDTGRNESLLHSTILYYNTLLTKKE